LSAISVIVIILIIIEGLLCSFIVADHFGDLVRTIG